MKKSQLDKETWHDKGIASRFLAFRTKYVSKNQTEAAKMLGIAQSLMSQIESAKRPVSVDSINVLIEKYRLNFDWMKTGKGKDRLPEVQEKTRPTPLIIQDMEVKIIAMQREIDILKVNQSAFINRIESLIKNLQHAQ